MSIPAPNLRSVPAVPEAVSCDLGAREQFELFLVMAEGTYGGWWFGAGDLIVCRGRARPGDVTVLVARGQGRPRLGRLDGAHLRGDGGELCHPGRWRTAGGVVARYRREAEGWTGTPIRQESWTFGSEEPSPPPVKKPAEAGAPELPAARRSLFAA